MDAGAKAGVTGVSDPVAVRVWDWPVRIVHWAMVLLLIALLTTAWIGGDAMTWHMRAGESMLTLVLFRVIWGFAGSRYARFTSFVRGPRAVITYARSILAPPHELHVGHNPLGGWMVIALLLALLFQTG
jgi:cytochrome b